MVRNATKPARRSSARTSAAITGGRMAGLSTAGNGRTSTAKASASNKTRVKAAAKGKTRAKAATKSRAAAKSRATTAAKSRAAAKARTPRAKTSSRVASKPRTVSRNGRGKATPSARAAVNSAIQERRLWLGLDEQPTAAMNELDVPQLPLESFEIAPTPADEIKDTSGGSTVFGWVGVGQAGGRIAQAFHGLGYGKSIAVNTCPHDLDAAGVPARQKLWTNIGYEDGGKDMERGRLAAEQYRQKLLHMIDHVFGHGVDHAMIAVGAGGGASGATTAVIDTLRAGAKRLGFRWPRRRIGVVCALPTAGEAASPKVRDNAYRLVTELSSLAQQGRIAPLIFVDNDKVERLYPKLTVKQFWPSVNNTVAGLFHVFNRLAALPSAYTSFDPADYRAIMQAGGCTVMGLTKLDKFAGQDDLSLALRQNLDKTLLADGFDLSTATQVGAIVLGGRGIMAQKPGLQNLINRAFDVLTDLTGQATVHRGIYQDNRESLRVYTIISGMAPPTRRINELGDTE
ncbi:MAG: hypothetical protein WD009_01235 [Phycisphaeraceae bacterium]